MDGMDRLIEEDGPPTTRGRAAEALATARRAHSAIQADYVARDAAIAEAYGLGVPQATIARELDVAESTILRVLVRQGV